MTMSAKIRIFKEKNLITETSLISPNEVTLTEQLIDQWTEFFRTNKLTLSSLKVESWDTIEFDVDGVVYSRNFIEDGENNEA